jgi:hypothetical protein
MSVAMPKIICRPPFHRRFAIDLAYDRTQLCVPSHKAAVAKVAEPPGLVDSDQ